MSAARIAAAFALALAFVPAAQANDTLVYHWPRYTSGPAQINVVAATDPGQALDPAFYPWLKLAVDNWNFACATCQPDSSPYVHLNLQPPRPCWFTGYDNTICVRQYWAVDGRGGYTGTAVKTLPLISYAQVSVNTQNIPIGDPFWSTMILCHELGEAIGLSDPSDGPVTPTVQQTCLTRDYSLLTSIPSQFNYQQLATLYAAVDVPPAVCKRKKGCR